MVIVIAIKDTCNEPVEEDTTIHTHTHTHIYIYIIGNIDC